MKIEGGFFTVKQHIIERMNESYTKRERSGEQVELKETDGLAELTSND